MAKTKFQIFASKSVEEIADYMSKNHFTEAEQRDTFLLKICFLLEDIRDRLKK